MADSTGIWKDAQLQAWRESIAVEFMKLLLQRNWESRDPDPGKIAITLADFSVRCVDELAKRLGLPVPL